MDRTALRSILDTVFADWVKAQPSALPGQWKLYLKSSGRGDDGEPVARLSLHPKDDYTLCVDLILRAKLSRRLPKGGSTTTTK